MTSCYGRGKEGSGRSQAVSYQEPLRAGGGEGHLAVVIHAVLGKVERKRTLTLHPSKAPEGQVGGSGGHHPSALLPGDPSHSIL